MKRILAIAVHPDDESLGCGGTLLRFSSEGHELHWCIVTDMTEEAGFSAERIMAREAEITEVAGMYGFSGVHRLGLPSTGLDALPMSGLISALGGVLDKVRPNVVFLPFWGDVHSDHQVVFQAAISCLKAFRRPEVEQVLAMETPSETEFAAPIACSAFQPNYFVDTTSTLERKIEILRCYAGEMIPHPFPRSEESVRAMATLRGQQAVCRYAEGFVLLRQIVR